MKKQQKLLNMMKNQTEKRPVDTLNLQTKNDDFSCDSSKYIYFRKWEAQAQFLGRGEMNVTQPSTDPRQISWISLVFPTHPGELPCYAPSNLHLKNAITMAHDTFWLTRVLTAPGLFARTSFTVCKTSTVCSVLTRSITDIMVATQPLRPVPSL